MVDFQQTGAFQEQPSVQAEQLPERVVTLTAPAQKEALRLLQEQIKQGLGLRLGIKGGGCSGLSYQIEFDEKRDGDTVIEYDGFQVYLDRKSTIYLRGVTLDFQSGLMSKGFVFQNPNAKSSCGCGESFSM